MEEDSEKDNRSRYKKMNIKSVENALLSALFVLAILFFVQLLGGQIQASYNNMVGKILVAIHHKP